MTRYTTGTTRYVMGSCHEWRGPRMGENRGYVCIECGERVEDTEDMRSAPKCRSRAIPLEWLPLKEQRERMNRKART